MRNRTEEINVRVFKTEKNLIRRKARKCGMNMSEYLRTLGTDTVVREAPKEELMQAYRKLTRLHDDIRYEVSMAAFSDALTEIEDLLLQAYIPALSAALGVFIPLIVVNCIIIGRAEAFCQKNTVKDGFFDGIFQGLGYTCVLIIMCVFREFVGSGRFGGGLIDIANGFRFTLDGTGGGIQIFPSDYGMSIMNLPFGGFLTLGLLIGLMQYALKKSEKKKKEAERAVIEAEALKEVEE